MIKYIVTINLILSLNIVLRAQLSEYKILPGESDSLHSFGTQVAISGDYAIVGTLIYPLQSDTGFAYIFKREGSSWIEQQKLTASDGNEIDYFGNSVSISGDYALVGAPTDDDNGEFSGSAYIFKRNGSTWIEKQKLLPSDGSEDDFFGGFLSISEDYAIIGAALGDGIVSESGAAYIFKRIDTIWVEDQKIFASDGAWFAGFGKPAIWGNIAIVGASGDDENGEKSGAAYIFKKDTAWVEVAKLQPSDADTADRFGSSVSISDGYVVIGATGNDDNGTNSGSTYIFRKSNELWIEDQKLTASDGSPLDVFGCSVSISGEYVIVGSKGDDDKGYNSGSAYIFRKSISSWIEEHKLTASDGSENDEFGSSVSVSGGYAIVSAPLDKDNGYFSGSAYLYNGFVVGVEDEQTEIPLSFTLQQNYPNPFNPSTKISWQSPVGSWQTLKIYDVLGNEVATLVDEYKTAGTYEVEWNAVGLPSGVYFYQIKTEGFIETKKMVLLK